MMMADWREKIKTISSSNGSSAPEAAKRAGIGCLAFFIIAVSILTFLISIGLFRSGNWIIALFILAFFALSSVTAAILLFPQKTDSL
jgi:CHASE2 domain-containing sensor protein